MNILIIHNSKSGRKSSQLLIDELTSNLSKNNKIHYLEVFDKRSMKDAIFSIQDNDLIIISGGDGTVSFYSEELVNLDKPLLIIPAGSGNDFANSLGANLDGKLIIDAINEQKMEKVATLLVNENNRILTIACFGFEARVNRLANKMPRFLGGFKYTLATFIGLFGKHYESLSIESDLIKESGDYSLAIVANTPSFGGGLKISNKANPFDEKMYLILVNKVTKLKLIYLFLLLLMRKHYSREEFREFEIKTLKVEKLDGVLQAQADGESLPEGSVTLKLDPNSLKVLRFE
jgi:diacylglycerol kinase (ATP)